MEHTPTVKLLGIIAVAFATGFGAYEAIVRATNGKSLFSGLASQSLNVAIRRVVDESNLPMYLIDRNLTVQGMNEAAGALLSLEPGKTNGKSIGFLIRHIARNVPEKWRSCFLEEQKELQELVEAGKLPEAEATVPVDLRHSPIPRIRARYILWIRAESLYGSQDDGPLGSLVFMRARKVPDWNDSELVALTTRCDQRNTARG